MGNIIILIIVIFVVALIMYHLYKKYEEPKDTFAGGGYDNDDEKAELSKRLENAGFILHSRDGCHWCVKQKEELGGDYKKTNIGNHKPSAYPTWVNEKSGNIYMGYKDREELKKMIQDELEDKEDKKNKNKNNKKKNV